MKGLFFAGLVVLILGVVSLIVPHSEREGFSVGGASLDVETRYEEKVHPALSAVLILGGLGAMAVGRRKTS